ncbi:MAG: hypothetical protein A2355_17600, partial [Spirochaetes bacterium RIFOXYB1_FULL_32_8]
MKKVLLMVLILSFCLAMMNSCSKDNSVLVTYQVGKDSQSIKIGDVKKEILSQVMYNPQVTNDMAWNKQMLMDRYVVADLIFYEQMALNFTNEPDFQNSMDKLYKRQYLISLNSKGQDYFYKSMNNSKAEIMKASHILLSVNEYTNIAGTNAKLPADLISNLSVINEKSAIALIESLKNSKNLEADFSNTAIQRSDDKGSGMRGGDLSYFSKGAMVPEFEKASFDAKSKGLILKPVKTQFGYHIIYVTTPNQARTMKEIE